MFRLGNFQFDRPLALAPMAGVSDRVFRELCRTHGADYTVSEMVTSDAALRASDKTQRRLELVGTSGIRIVQIAGAEARALAEAARYCAERGADVIDINMGCPAKKVCNKQAGSALLRDESLVAELLAAVVAAVDLPVTLKMRTGWDPSARNAPAIARIAEDIGVQLLTVHGRTRACAFRGDAEYETIARIKQSVSIPVIANGDIRDAANARSVLAATGCDGLMIGRAAYGNPWIFGQIKSVLDDGDAPMRPSGEEIVATLRTHVRGLHALYGRDTGSRVARKHVGWYASKLAGGDAFRRAFNRLDSPELQISLIDNYQNEAQGALAA